MPAPAAEQTVFLLDDDHSARTSLIRLLNYARIRAEGFSTPEALLERLERDAAGCLILDVRMPGLNGLDFYDALVADRKALPVVFLSGYLDVTLTVRAMRVGAIDALQKPVVRDVLLDAVKRAFQRDEGRRARLAEEQSVRARFDSLTPRERDVLAQVVRGEATRSIATGLGSSEKTIKAHRSHVMRKFGVRRTADLVRVTEGLVTGREGSGAGGEAGAHGRRVRSGRPATHTGRHPRSAHPGRTGIRGDRAERAGSSHAGTLQATGAGCV